ncbi:ATP-dependent RNA helicase DbpA [Lachnotalea glycerini]|uniref:ATP-dependent RNA helicase DbpA n=1 Tax=Lachnotalea glycerini TaxID=1763509 RepID=A0A318EUN6_9FIRM|nr:DEAD/DEAH box helicase [Lachnotalea glycerini]PXV93300.1 ATP-dependent RNA helicase DbpA [Lachnotalea glycerini]
MKQNKFEEYQLSNEIIEALTMLGYTTPTQIQERVIPYALENKDIVAKSKTGSGKTAAFAIPLCEMVVWDEKLAQALVLEPTRELTNQVKEEIFNIGRKKRLKVCAIFGGFPIDKQVITLKQKANILVGTPGRVLDHLRRGTLKTDKIKYLIIDEADLMMDMGFIDDVKQIISYLNNRQVTMLFSATMGENIKNLADHYLTNPIEIMIESNTKTVDSVIQEGYYSENEDKLEDLLAVLMKEEPENCMIFCATREMVNVLYRQLTKVKIQCSMLHGLIDQQQRLKAIDEFQEGRYRYLIATDVAARGVDFDNITHVINYDLPTSKEAYVHRIGRTGRNGKSGKAISFIQESERRQQKIIEEYTGVTITVLDIPIINEEKKKEFYQHQQKKRAYKAKKGAIFNSQITKICISGGRKSKLRAGDIVGTVCSIKGIVGDDIGIIDIRDSLTYLEILNGKGEQVFKELQGKTIKGKIRNVKMRK